MFLLANVGVEAGFGRTDQFTFANVSSRLATHDLENLSFESVGAEFADGFAERPVTLLGQSALDMLEPATAEGLGGRTILDVGHTDILKLAYG